MSFNFINPLKKRFPTIARINMPIDGGIILRDGERLLGGSQGFLSLVAVIFVPIILSLWLQETFAMLLLKSICVFGGDAIGSFIKRRLHVPRGAFLPGIDHGDYMIMSLIVFCGLGSLSLTIGIVALILTYIFHPLACLLGYKLGIKDEPF